MNTWRQEHGHLVIANTSASPATELPTANFLHQHLESSLDGLVFSRDIKGNSIGKGESLARAMAEAGLELPSTVLHIDDKPDHHLNVADTFASHEIETGLFLPAYPGNQEAHRYPGVIMVGNITDPDNSPLATFRAMDQYLDYSAGR